MATVEFQAKVENGIIAVPDTYKQELADGDIVTVIVLKSSRTAVRPDLIDQLTEMPVTVDRFLSRDEAHDRHL
jgi:hypothetical protein